jgi:hypothetical protein
MARVPRDLAARVEAYAATHGVTLSQLVRAGLTHILTQPPDRVVPPAAPPAPTPPPRAAPPRLGHRIARVLKAHPAGIDVAMLTAQLNAGKTPTSRTWVTRAQVGSYLRHQYHLGQVERLERGLYTARRPGAERNIV